MACSGPWEGAGARQGVQVWRVENFRPVLQKDPKQLGKFFTGALDACVLAIAAVSCFPTNCSSPPRVAGDSYVVLHTVSSAAGSSTYNVHFWLGAKSTQVGIASVKTGCIFQCWQQCPPTQQLAA